MNMKSAQIFLGLGVLVIALLAFTTSKPVSAAQLESTKLTLSDPRASETSTYTFNWTTSTGGSVLGVKFLFCKTPSGGCNTPSNMDTQAAAKGSVTNLTGTADDWSLDNNVDGTIYLTDAGGGNVADGTVVTVSFTGVTNHTIAGCNASVGDSSDTCYVRLGTYSNTDFASTHLIDEAIVSYTAVAAVTVSARVDPTFTFVVSPVGTSTVHNGITTSVSSTYSTLPFGNLTAGTPKYAAHQLNVTTNTTSGYSVTMKMHQQMTGVYSANNIDPYSGNSATWGDPKAWLEPSGGTANTDTAWIGANTTDADITSFTTEEFGPVNSTANTVMTATSSDNGGTAVYVTYAIEANVYQPADTYSGTLVYNALPTY